MKIIGTSVAKLIEDPANPRLHDRRNLDAIKASLSKFGQVEPLVVQKDTNMVIGGNGRLTAMKELGWQRAEAVFLEIDDVQARALSITLNRTGELATWDTANLMAAISKVTEGGLDMEVMGWTSGELEKQMSMLNDSMGLDQAKPRKAKPPKSPHQGPVEWQLLVGPCERHLASLEPESVDSLVTDPPAGIGFMGKDWDSDKGGRAQWVAWLTGVMRLAFRAMKPGAHGLVWAIPRTSHWTATALEDAGFEVRDVVSHMFGTGFPKSRDVSKAIDKQLGAKRPVVGVQKHAMSDWDADGGTKFVDRAITEAASPEAQQWEGWGTALKPGSEHWILVRKPLQGSVAENVLKHGVGGVNVGDTRIGDDEMDVTRSDGTVKSLNSAMAFHNTGRVPAGTVIGRWPSNVLMSHLEECQENACATGCPVQLASEEARFFYCPKPDRGEKDAGCDGLPMRRMGVAAGPAGWDDKAAVFNTHPTVKSIALMRYLARLVTPPDGLVLDPFAGSGTTGCAAVLEGFRFCGVELETPHACIAWHRLTHWEQFCRTEP